MDSLLNQLMSRIAEISLSDAQIQSYGRWLAAAMGAYYVVSAWQKDTPTDVQAAITGHMVQGYDRSTITTRLEQRHTRQLLQQIIGLNELRQQLRSETDKEAKLRGWQRVFRLTLISIAATTYTHSLTISLLSIKNMVRVLVFLLSRRESAALSKSRSGPISTLRAWWTGGRRAGLTGIMMESMMAKMAEQVSQQASPFVNAELEEEVMTEEVRQLPVPPPPLDGRTAFAQAQQQQESLEAAHGESLSQVEQAFSVRAVLEVAVPRIVACAAAAVDSAIAARPAHLFSVSGIVHSADLCSLLRDIALGMERRACVSEWVRRPHPSLVPMSRARSGASTSPLASVPKHLETSKGRLQPDEDEELLDEPDQSATSSEDIIEFPHGSTTLLRPDGRPVRRRAGDRSEDKIIDGLLDRRLAAEEEALQEEAIRRDHLLKRQMAGFFTELSHSASFGELCITYAAELLAAQFKEAGDIKRVKTYDAATDTAKMAMVIAALDSCRLAALEEECEVKSYMRLFCEETIRSTCAR
ncbi:conserved hypothetical protein [Leishmania infantum JPCM5]|uniref:Uncharacterized protein n=2 Tax=Leishmania infantum TaxID=5671 RepID=A4ICZ4_LEIIN|nr:conserved hypothetical protein [Leishmania infantum JPCM5]CAC9551588.1 hypothetical_protein_-_conserved [Leishmania infantum]CAM72723.1 conserved hypothetical protein [Leishmania infantum JPCM5]SUZ46801.1 hypothetical_protein_-_conserved [Leishmania infantum]|eukprot:XP_001469613.1 conserved hypothetical protein [Leishmania infantum JPCM5]